MDVRSADQGFEPSGRYLRAAPRRAWRIQPDRRTNMPTPTIDPRRRASARGSDGSRIAAGADRNLLCQEIVRENVRGTSATDPRSTGPPKVPCSRSRHSRPPLAPGPRTIRPGIAPVCSPSRITATPLTKTSRMPSES